MVWFDFETGRVGEGGSLGACESSEGLVTLYCINTFIRPVSQVMKAYKRMLHS